jgi:hypothetical protein
MRKSGEILKKEARRKLKGKLNLKWHNKIVGKNKGKKGA